MAKKYYWLKLQKDFFKRHDIRVLEEQENGKDYVLFYLKLLLESVSHEGHLRFNDTIPYDEKMLAVITNTNIDIVRSAVAIFQRLNLMEIMDDRTIYMSETHKMVGAESRQAEIMRKNREEEKVIKKLAKQEETHIPYIENYTNNKRYGGNYYVVFQRDGKQCVSCGSKQNLCVHHIIGYDENNPITTQRNNLITLCRTCHSKEHALPTSIITKEMLKEIKFDFDLYNEIYKISNCVGNGNNVTPMLQKSYIEKEKELDKEIDIEIEPKVDKKKITKKEKPPKTAYGEFGRVALTDEELKKLQDLFPTHYQKYLQNLDYYLESSNKRYKSHYAVIRQWLSRDGIKEEEKLEWIKMGNPNE